MLPWRAHSAEGRLLTCCCTLTCPLSPGAGQVVEEAQQPLAEYYRHISKGAWPFSTRDHGWPISDCSSEGLKAALMLAQARAAPSLRVVPA